MLCCLFHQATMPVCFACQGPFAASDPSRTSTVDNSLPSDASGFPEQARHHVQQQQRQQQQQQPGAYNFDGFDRQQSTRTPTAGLSVLIPAASCCITLLGCGSHQDVHCCSGDFVVLQAASALPATATWWAWLHAPDIVCQHASWH